MTMQGNTVSIIDTYVLFKTSQFNAAFDFSAFVDSVRKVALATFPAYGKRKTEKHEDWLERVNQSIGKARRAEFRNELVRLLTNNVTLELDTKNDGTNVRDFEDMPGGKLGGHKVNRAVKTINDDVSRALKKLHLQVRERESTGVFAKAESAIALAKALLAPPQAARAAGIVLPKDADKASAILRAMAHQIKAGKVEGFDNFKPQA